MLEHAPPSAEPIPASESDPTRFLNVNKHMAQPASQQIQTTEANLGIVDHNGLSWVNDGRIYVVRDRGAERRAVIDPQTGKPVSSTRLVGPIVRKRSGLVGRGRREIHETETEIADTLYVDVYDGNRPADEPVKDRLVKVEALPATEFDDYIDTLVNRDKSGYGVDFWWQEEQRKEPPRDRRINVRVPTNITPKEDDKTTVQYVQETQQANDLSDWSGLHYRTYNTDGELEQSEILRDVTISERTFDGWVKKRYFEVQKSNNDGPLSRSMISASNVRQVLDRTERNILDIHFRVNGAEMDQRAQFRRLGNITLSRAKYNWYGPKVSHIGGKLDVKSGLIVGHVLDADNATDLLSGGDIYTGAELDERKRQFNEHPHHDERALALIDLSEEFGPARLIELAKRIKSNYAADAKKIGLPPEKDDSVSWVLWDLAKQYYLAQPQYADQVTSKDAGIEEGSPFGYGPKHMEKQQELIDDRVGAAFANMLVKRKLAQLGEEIVQLPNGQFTKVIKERYVVIKDDKLMKDLKMPHAIKNQLDAILSKITSEDGELGYKDKVEIGRLLRQEFAH